MATEIIHDDIQIISEYPVTWEQKEELLYKDQPIFIADKRDKYKDYRPTLLQFEIRSNKDKQTIQLVIPYQNRLTTVEAKHSVICRYSEEQQQWIPLSTTIDTKNKRLSVQVDRIGLYTVFVNYYWYSSYTSRFAEEFPHWTRIRKTKESLGQRFLNFFGLHLEEIEEFLRWISEQKYIRSADIHVYDWIYVYELRDIKQTDEVQCWVSKDGIKQTVPLFETIREFFYNPSNRGGIIDYDKKRFYSKVRYESLWFEIKRGNEQYTFESKPTPFHIWNSIDDIGLLVGVKRLYLESNESMRERILDVFRYPSNTSDEGLTNGIARELNMIRRVTWKDDRKPLYLENKSGLWIDPRFLRVDGQPLEEDLYQYDPEGNILIRPLNKGVSHVVSFIQGIEKYELHRKDDDEALHRILFLPNGQATETFRYWVKYIQMIAPIMWDEFQWDVGFWDTVDQHATGIGFIPNMWDSDISPWKNYTFDPKRWRSENIW